MIDFLIKTIFLHKEKVNRLRFERCLKERYSALLDDARELCTAIRNSSEYKNARKAYKRYTNAEYNKLTCYLNDRAEDHWKRQTLVNAEADCANELVKMWQKLDSKFSFSYVESMYQDLVHEIMSQTSYNPKSIVLYSDHAHYGYEIENLWRYVRHCGYDENHFIEYCTTYDLMCLIGDYCDWSDCKGLPHLDVEKHLHSPCTAAKQINAEEVYKKAREALFGIYDMEGDDQQLEKLNQLVTKI